MRPHAMGPAPPISLRASAFPRVPRPPCPCIKLLNNRQLTQEKVTLNGIGKCLKAYLT